jgi:hypothetical protein
LLDDLASLFLRVATVRGSVQVRDPTRFRSCCRGSLACFGSWPGERRCWWCSMMCISPTGRAVPSSELTALTGMPLEEVGPILSGPVEAGTVIEEERGGELD